MAPNHHSYHRLQEMFERYFCHKRHFTVVTGKTWKLRHPQYPVFLFWFYSQRHKNGKHSDFQKDVFPFVAYHGCVSFCSPRDPLKHTMGLGVLKLCTELWMPFIFTKSYTVFLLDNFRMLMAFEISSPLNPYSSRCLCLFSIEENIYCKISDYD